MTEHWDAGHADAAKTLAHGEIFKLPQLEDNPAVHDFLTAPAHPIPLSSKEKDSHEHAE
jgi:NTE family protein